MLISSTPPCYTIRPTSKTQKLIYQKTYYDKWIQEHHYDKNERFRQSFFFQITQYQNSAKIWMEYIQDLEKQIKELRGTASVRYTLVRRSGGPS